LCFIASHFYGFSSTGDKEMRKGIPKPMHAGNGHSHIHDVNMRYKLYNLCQNDIEGYSEKLSGRDYTYPSLREDANKPLISRASTGKLNFEILTASVPVDYSSDELTFFYYSNIDLNILAPFDVFVNDRLLLTFRANENGTLDILDNPGKGDVDFVLVRRDENKDGVGAFRLTMPTDLISKGKKVKIKVQGHKKGSRSWFMLFKVKDAVKQLKMAALNEVSFSIKQQGEYLYIDAPRHFSGKKVVVKSDGKVSAKVLFKAVGDLSKAHVKIKTPKNNFAIIYDATRIDISFENKKGTCVKSDVIGPYFYHFDVSEKSYWKASITKLYKPSLFKTYANFFDEKHEDGTVAILNSSHQDIAWMDRPEVCIILRDTLLFTPVIKDAFSREDYGFDVEDGLMLREYIERHPAAKDKITTLLNTNKLSVGASYNCPYEDMYDAEDLVRQFYLGKKWVKKTFGGYDSKVYWNVDVPGKTLQFPQILKKAGVDFMVISRHAKGMFNWQSQDGSSVFTYSPGHYGDDYVQLTKNLTNKLKYGATQVNYWSQYFKDSQTITPLLSSQDMIPALDYTDYINAWNGFKSVKNEQKESVPLYLPTMEVMTADELMALAQENATSIKTIQGERPNVWVYIHGPAHHEAITASRTASKLLPAAEKFSAVANTLNPKQFPYPFKKFDEAWQAKIYPDHGWGGHDGDITDDLFKSKLVQSKVMGQDLLNKGTNFIAGLIKTNDKKGIPVVLFNSLSWERTDPVSVTVNFEKGSAKSVAIVSDEQEEIPSQLNNIKYYKDGSIKSASVVFIAKDIPSIGYKTFYIKERMKSPNKYHSKNVASEYENSSYKVNFSDGGIAQIYDKELQRNLLDTSDFKGGDVFTMYSNGNGAGEFGDIQQPFMKDFDKVSAHNATWKIIEDGSVYTTYQLKQAVLHATVQQEVTIYHQLKRILFHTDLLNWDGTLYREFRTAFPIAMEDPQISHEVPFGTVNVGKDEIHSAGDRYTPLCKNVHPRAIIDWIAASDSEMTVTMSSSVAAVDWIDPTKENKKSVLQHLLLASRTSCHWEGNEYSQEGSHSYNHILTSNKVGDIVGNRMAKQHNDPLHVVLYPSKSVHASLPESTSFFAIDKGNIIITALKKAEDVDELVLRMYDTEAIDSEVKLKSFFKIKGLQKTNIIEENRKPISKIKVPKFSIETFSFKVK